MIKVDELTCRVIEFYRNDFLIDELDAVGYETLVRLVIGNSGNTSIAIDDAKVLNDAGRGKTMIDSDVLPFILKPGEMAVLPLSYRPDPIRSHRDPDPQGWDEGITVHIISHSSKGKRYATKKQLVTNGRVAIDALGVF